MIVLHDDQTWSTLFKISTGYACVLCVRSSAEEASHTITIAAATIRRCVLSPTVVMENFSIVVVVVVVKNRLCFHKTLNAVTVFLHILCAFFHGLEN